MGTSLLVLNIVGQRQEGSAAGESLRPIKKEKGSKVKKKNNHVYIVCRVCAFRNLLSGSL
jgi:hypothetical protein